MHGHGCMLQVTKREQHGNVEVENKKQYLLFPPDAVHSQGQNTRCDITGRWRLTSVSTGL